ncbi:AAA family ATPase [Desulfofundulus thermosubterraneus]|uniref:MoxR-like ATPase n=1 Tax=Desulfofundulus thermosubterraneus DSM 16057 TaxID=1121432 RepID=A0A1M6K7R0_9FIRM|nr:MoxR family ATPase [Desulfofundulus thermosubterraneus]SHJ54964.1 MoxR-like ATPase [Desulfofundulus thermosubterraneus DSM 16057]
MDLTIKQLQQRLETQGYICDQDLVVTLYLSLKLAKPLLVEGAPGVGKTEVAKALAGALNTELIRLQCYEGLDENRALYEWNYQRQLLKIEIARGTCEPAALEKDLFDVEYLLERPLLKAIRAEKRVVLLIDEIDKTDPEFEAFLFELLSDFQVSIPELGTLKAKQIPAVVLTSNGERELSDGLKRRCIYLYIDYPTLEKEIRILQVKVPQAQEELVHQVARAVNFIRSHLDLKKKPSIAETLDWTRALVALHADALTPEIIGQTLSLFLKNRDDQETLKREVGLNGLVEQIQGMKSDSSTPARATCHCGHHHH